MVRFVVAVWFTSTGVLAQPVQAIAADESFSSRTYTSEAYALGSDTLLYYEEHTEFARDGQTDSLVTRYLDPAGTLFAERKLVYRGRPAWAPDYRLEDFRSGRRESVRARGDTVTIRLRTAAGEPEQIKQIANDPALVIDGGFAELMRNRREILQAGKSVKFRFVVPARMGAYAFAMKKERGVATDDPTHVPVELNISNWLVRMFIDPIRVVYDTGETELVRYRGVSNIWDSNEQVMNVEIRYPQPPSRTAWMKVDPVTRDSLPVAR